MGGKPVGEDHPIVGDPGGRLEQTFLQRDQAVDGLLLRGCASRRSEAAVIAARLERSAATVLEGIGRHDHVVRRGIERLERNQIELAVPASDHKVGPINQWLAALDSVGL